MDILVVSKFFLRRMILWFLEYSDTYGFEVLLESLSIGSGD